MSSDVAVIVDYTAARAASHVTGIVAAYGSGAGNVDDPLRSGQKIQAANFAPTVPMEHWSEVAAMTDFAWLTQDGGAQVTWDVAMRCFVNVAEFAELRRVVQPLFPLYLAAFQSDPKLNGLALTSRITRMDIGVDPPLGANRARWGWLEVHLSVTEVVDP